jgi:hypothetical protein
MFWLADAEVLGNGLSASMTHGHMSSGSASTHLLCLCDHNHLLQTWRASRLPHPQVMRPLWGAVSMPEALHRDTYIEKWRLVQTTKSHSQQIHPEVFDPLP